MKFLAFQKQMGHYPVFTVRELKLLFPNENLFTVQKQLSTWSKQGKLVKLKNGVYVLAPDYTKEPVMPEVVSARLYDPSYISLQYALSLYGMVPEAVFEITSVTTRPTRFFQTSLGSFRYRTVKASCFFGFSAVKQGKFSFYLASREKALLDYLYLNSYRLEPERETWEEMRLQNLEQIHFKTLFQHAKRIGGKKLLSLLRSVKQYATSY